MSHFAEGYPFKKTLEQRQAEARERHKPETLQIHVGKRNLRKGIKQRMMLRTNGQQRKIGKIGALTRKIEGMHPNGTETV